MIRTPSGKNLMNEQEAIQWLLDNNALPFQCTANYVAGAEIGLGTIVNPSPAKVRVGSLIFFADSKVSTVIAITSNSFICSDEYNDLVDDVVYVSNVQLNASGHLIVALSNGTNIDAGLIKQVSSFSIDASQHLIVSYNDGTTTDLGAIFSGNVNIAGNFTANSIIENMGAAYTMALETVADLTLEAVYGGIVKNGNKVTIVGAFNATRTGSILAPKAVISVGLPLEVAQKIYVSAGSYAVLKNNFYALDLDNDIDKDIALTFNKYSNYDFRIVLNVPNDLELNTKYYIRFECTLLLSNSLL